MLITLLGNDDPDIAYRPMRLGMVSLAPGTFHTRYAGDIRRRVFAGFIENYAVPFSSRTCEKHISNNLDRSPAL